jgi:hypothetical protein
MYINNESINTRHNRPTVLSKTALVCYFFNDGTYADPYEISSVSIFRSSSNFYPSSVIGPDGQILQNASSLILFNCYNTEALTSDPSFEVANYTGSETGIYRLREGVYVVILDNAVTSTTFNLSGSAETIENGVDSTGDYIDVWTVRRASGSKLDTVINNFTLNEDRFYSTTEPILFRVHTRLANRYLNLGSRVDLKFTNEVNIENTNIDSSMLNMFKQSIIINPSIEIYKENVDRNLPSRVTVSSFSDTSSTCDVTSDNTVIFNFDTEELKTHPRLLDGTLGSMTGTYSARIKFSALNQVFYSNTFSFIVN